VAKSLYDHSQKKMADFLKEPDFNMVFSQGKGKNHYMLYLGFQPQKISRYMLLKVNKKLII
jgi:hypothetical protein